MQKGALDRRPLAHDGAHQRGLPRLGLCALVAGVAMLGWSTLRPTEGLSRSLRLSPQIPVTAADQGLAAANNSPVLATDPGDDRFMALANRRDAPDYACGLHVSGDRGRGWVPVDPVGQLPAGAEKCYAPEVAIDGQGTLYFLFVGLAGPGNHPVGAFLTSSTDRGRTFSRPREVLGPENFSVRLAVEPEVGRRGRVHLVWVHAASDIHLGGFGAPPNPILAAHSDDGGQTFSEPVQVSDPDRALVNAPALSVGEDGAVHVAYYDLGDDRRDYEGLEGPVWDGDWSLVVTSSSDGGRRFGPGRVAEAKVVPTERVIVIFTMSPPALAVGGKRVCVGWTDGRHGDSDAFLRCSKDKGAHWGAAHRLNDDPVGNGRSQYLPQVSIAPGGRVDAVFYDRRQDAYNANADVSYTFSVDGGKTFATNAALTTEGMSYTQIGQQYAIPSAGGMFDFGSRIAVASGPDDVVAAWTDTHNAAPPTRAQDVFAAKATVLGAKQGRGGILAGFGVILLLGGTVATGRSAVRRRADGRMETGR